MKIQMESGDYRSSTSSLSRKSKPPMLRQKQRLFPVMYPFIHVIDALKSCLHTSFHHKHNLRCIMFICQHEKLHFGCLFGLITKITQPSLLFTTEQKRLDLIPVICGLIGPPQHNTQFAGSINVFFTGC